MAFPVALAVGVATVGLWLSVLYVVASTWRQRRREPAPYEPDPEDGCGCVEVWEYLSERRSD